MSDPDAAARLIALSKRKVAMRFAYHWLREYLRDQSIGNIRRKLREFRRLIDHTERYP